WESAAETFWAFSTSSTGSARRPLLEVGDPGVERLDVRHLLDGGQGGAELGDLCGEVDGSHEARVYGRALGARGAAGAPWRAREGSVPRRGAVPGRRERPEPEVTPHLGQQLLPVLERSAGGTGTGGEIPRLLDAGRLQLLAVQG